MAQSTQQNLLNQGSEAFYRSLVQLLGEADCAKLWLLPTIGFVQYNASPYTTPRNANRDLAEVLAKPFIHPEEDRYEWQSKESASFGFGQSYIFFSRDEIKPAEAPTGFNWTTYSLAQIETATQDVLDSKPHEDKILRRLVGQRLDSRFDVESEKLRVKELSQFMTFHDFRFIYWLLPESFTENQLRALSPAGFEFKLPPLPLATLVTSIEEFLGKFDAFAIDLKTTTDAFRLAVWWANVEPLILLKSTGEILQKKIPAPKEKLAMPPATNDFFVKKRAYYLFNLVQSMLPSAGFEVLRRYGVLSHNISELADGFGLAQNRFHDFDIYYHSIYACDASIGSPAHIRFAALFHDLGKVPTRKEKPNGEATFHNHEMVSTKITSRILGRSGFDEAFIDQVRFLVRNHMFHYTNEWTDKAVRRFVRKVENDNLKEMLLLRFADRLGSGKKAVLPKQIHRLIEHVREIEAEAKKRKVTDLLLGGKELQQEFGLEPSPLYGEILRHLLAKVDEDPERNNTETLKLLTANYLATLDNGPKSQEKES